MYAYYLISKGGVMNKARISGILAISFLCFTSVSAQVSNDFSLKANDGKTYNLYELLAKGSHVILHFTTTS